VRHGHPGQADAISFTLAEWLFRTAGRIDPSVRDHIIVFGEPHFRRILRSYACYYNGIRTDRSLEKDAPLSRPVQRNGSIKSHTILGGLHHHYYVRV
jgi:hypothetical protein